MCFFSIEICFFYYFYMSVNVEQEVSSLWSEWIFEFYINYALEKNENAEIFSRIIEI